MPTYDLIATATLTSSNPRVQFSNIPNTYTDLVIVGRFMGSATTYVGVQFNADTSTSSTSYSSTYWQNRGYGRQTNTYVIAGGPTYSSNANDASTIHIDINEYTKTDRYKSALIRHGNAGGASSLNYSGGVWRNTAAINAIDIFSANVNSYGAGTSMSLYGIKAG